MREAARERAEVHQPHVARELGARLVLAPAQPILDGGSRHADDRRAEQEGRPRPQLERVLAPADEHQSGSPDA